MEKWSESQIVDATEKKAGSVAAQCALPCGVSALQGLAKMRTVCSSCQELKPMLLLCVLCFSLSLLLIYCFELN